MKNDNSSYTVTPPDLFLSENGVNALIVSTDDNLIDGIKLLFEKYIMSSIVFNVQKNTTSGNLAWLFHVSTSCEFMVVDLDTCKVEDITSALLKSVDESHIVIFVSLKQKKRDLIRLINAKSKYLIFSSIVQLDQYLQIETMPGLVND
jgi:hypothetical protein